MTEIAQIHVISLHLFSHTTIHTTLPVGFPSTASYFVVLNLTRAT